MAQPNIFIFAFLQDIYCPYNIPKELYILIHYWHFCNSYRQDENEAIVMESKEVQTALISEKQRVRFSIGVQTPLQSYFDKKVSHTQIM